MVSPCRDLFFLGTPLGLAQRKRASPRGEAGTSGFLCALYSPWNSPGQNTGVGSLSLVQGIFPTQGLKPGLLHCRQILYQLSHRGSPHIYYIYPLICFFLQRHSYIISLFFKLPYKIPVYNLASDICRLYNF